MRKEAGLAVSDRIRLHISADASVVQAAESHRAWIADEVLATELVVGGEPQGHMMARHTMDLDGIRVDLALTKDE
jgi:hypothetical protein